MKKYKIGFLIFCLVISLFLNLERNCIGYDSSADIDPIRGSDDGCSYSVDNFSFLKFASNAFGLYIFGFLAHEFIKKREI